MESSSSSFFSKASPPHRQLNHHHQPSSAASLTPSLHRSALDHHPNTRNRRPSLVASCGPSSTLPLLAVTLQHSPVPMTSHHHPSPLVITRHRPSTRRPLRRLLRGDTSSRLFFGVGVYVFQVGRAAVLACCDGLPLIPDAPAGKGLKSDA